MILTSTKFTYLLQTSIVAYDYTGYGPVSLEKRAERSEYYACQNAHSVLRYLLGKGYALEDVILYELEQCHGGI